MSDFRHKLFSNAYADMKKERIRAHEKHVAKGLSMEDLPHDSPKWLPVVVEEVGEIARALNDGADLDHLREEIVQTAAMCAAWIDAIDYKDGDI